MTAREQQARFARDQELEAAVREWIHETVGLLRELRDDVYLETGGIAREFRREILLIHQRKGERLLRGEAPETNAADALREAVLWFDELQAANAESVHGGPWMEVQREPPRWYQWAVRILPSAAVSRWARMARQGAEVDA